MGRPQVGRRIVIPRIQIPDIEVAMPRDRDSDDSVDQHQDAARARNSATASRERAGPDLVIEHSQEHTDFTRFYLCNLLLLLLPLAPNALVV